MRLDIVMPAHNEQERIDRTLRAYRDACPPEGVRFLVALDSCTDRTPEIVRAHERADRRVRSFEYPKLGKGGVIAETFSRSDADLVAFVDADGATPPRELGRARPSHAGNRCLGLPPMAFTARTSREAPWRSDERKRSQWVRASVRS